MAAWRGGRARVWMTGAVTFIVAIPCAFTGYISQQNFDSQWIATQGKDGMNSLGVGRSSMSSTSARCTATTYSCSDRSRRAGVAAHPARAPPRDRAPLPFSDRVAATAESKP